MSAKNEHSLTPDQSLDKPAKTPNHIATSKKNSFILISTGIGILIIGIIFIINAQFKNNAGNNSNTTSNQVKTVKKDDEAISDPKTAKTKPKEIGLNTLFFGDVFWGRYIDDWSKASNLKSVYPFSGLNTFDRTKYDAWIADMECPITTTYLDSKTQDAQLKFSCPTEYTTEAAKWFNAFTLANNHMDNMQEVNGLEQTRQNLEKNHIQYFGNFDNSVKSDICEIVSLKGKNIYLNSTDQNNDTTDSFIPLALCGFHDVFKLPKDDELAIISEYSKYLPTIVMPHQGKEYTYTADSLQQTYYRKMIDLGADAVIGDHVHSVQNTEAYKGKLIAYSVGNFIFDQQRSAQVTQSIGANLDFTFQNDDNLQKWLEFSKSCQKFKDDCLENAKKLNLKKPKFTIKYDVVCNDNSGKLAKKASDKVCQDLQKKTNWSSTKAFLN